MKDGLRGPGRGNNRTGVRARNRGLQPEVRGPGGPAAADPDPEQGTAPAKAEGGAGPDSHAVAELPALERHVAVDLALRQHAGRLEHDFLDFCRLAEECIEQNHWARFGYPGPQEYFEERVGISYRSLRRRLSVLEALKRLPEAERPEAEAAVLALGSHKSAALARAIGREGVDWRQLVEFAQRATAEAVQERVTIETGGKPRGDPGRPR